MKVVMHIQQLEKIVSEWNADALDVLQKKAIPEADRTIPAQNIGAVLHLPPASAPTSTCFCGVLRKRPATSADHASIVTLSQTGGTNARVAVGGLIDSLTRTSGDIGAIVVAIGINYGQGAQYLNWSPQNLFDDTRMRDRVDAAFQAIDDPKCRTAKCALNTDVPKDYHLVAVNFFPLLTTVPWSELGLNSIQEALLIHCDGFADPVGVLIDLIERLCRGGDDTDRIFVFFHGANNAVPYLGAELYRRIQREPDLIESGVIKVKEFIFADNLARPRPIWNAVRLCYKPLVSKAGLAQPVTE
jgi:hypothetical protein